MHQRAPDSADSLADARQPSGTRRWAGVAGVVAGLAGLAISDLASWLIAPAGSPVPAVGSMIINILPATLVNWGKETLGTADKPFLVVLIFVAVLAICGLAGQLELRRTYAGAAIFGAIAVIGVLGVATGAQSSVRAYLPTLIGLVLGYLILNALLTRLRRWQPRRAAADDDRDAASPARRSFLGLTILVGAAAAVGAVAGRALAGAAGAVQDARSKFTLPKAGNTAAVPAGADLHVPDMPPYVTPNDDFYRIDTALQVPAISPDEWSLTIKGMVDKEVTITYADLIALPLEEHLATLTCVSNEVGGDLIGNALWLGYPIRKLLAEAGPQSGADMVLSTSEDGFTAGSPLSALTDPDREAIFAIGMNGEPLPIEHGYPVRMVVPGLYGYVSATKWVVELKVTTYAKDMGYWTPLGWSALGPIKIGSRIDVPRKSVVPAGQVVVAGVAWAQHTGISKVEISIDDTWHDATLADTAGPDTWRQWKYDWADATPGTHKLAVRATDAKGLVQTSDLAAPAPDGATGWHTRSVKIG
jgi:DMSO/TMAO reductase YedYZ molybdopterin-dependent catalytic subunit